MTQELSHYQQEEHKPVKVHNGDVFHQVFSILKSFCPEILIHPVATVSNFVKETLKGTNTKTAPVLLPNMTKLPNPVHKTRSASLGTLCTTPNEDLHNKSTIDGKTPALHLLQLKGDQKTLKIKLGEKEVPIGISAREKIKSTQFPTLLQHEKPTGLITYQPEHQQPELSPKEKLKIQINEVLTTLYPTELLADRNKIKYGHKKMIPEIRMLDLQGVIKKLRKVLIKKLLEETPEKKIWESVALEQKIIQLILDTDFQKIRIGKKRKAISRGKHIASDMKKVLWERLEAKEAENRELIAREITFTDSHGDWKAVENVLRQEGVLDNANNLTEEVLNGKLNVKIDFTGDGVNLRDRKDPILANIVRLQKLLPKGSSINYTVNGNHCLAKIARVENNLRRMRHLPEKEQSKAGLRAISKEQNEQFNLIRNANIIDFDFSAKNEPVIIRFHGPNLPVWLLEEAVKIKAQEGDWIKALNKKIYHSLFKRDDSGSAITMLNKKLFGPQSKEAPEKYWKRKEQKINELLDKLCNGRPRALLCGHIALNGGKHESHKHGSTWIFRGDLAVSNCRNGRKCRAKDGAGIRLDRLLKKTEDEASEEVMEIKFINPKEHEPENPWLTRKMETRRKFEKGINKARQQKQKRKAAQRSRVNNKRRNKK